MPEDQRRQAETLAAVLPITVAAILGQVTFALVGVFAGIALWVALRWVFYLAATHSERE